MSVLIDESDFYELTWDYLEKAASQNVVYTEIFFDPQGHTSRGVAFETVIRGIRKAQVDAEQKLGIRSQLIMCFLRDMSAESAMEHLQMAKPYLGWLVGVGLDSDEYNNPPVKFKDVFALAKQWGLKLTMHCDVNQKNTLDHIRQVIEVIGVDRIDHGVNSLESDELCELIVEKQLGLTVCPVSNRFVVQSLTANEIRTMLDKGMLATINSDDPAYFRAYMNENLIELQQEGEFSQRELKTLMANAFKVTWLPEEDKAAYLAKLDAYQ